MTRTFFHRILVTMLVLTATLTLEAQSSFAFLSLPVSARMNALGGTNVSIKDGDVSFAMENPALLSQATDKFLMLDYAYLGKGLNFGNVMYAHNFSDNVKLEKEHPEMEKNNYFAVGVHFLDYGKMPYADEYGNLSGLTFSAKDICINAIYARQLGPYCTVGVNIKPVYSIYETYSSFALGADIGGHFQTLDKSFQLGIALRNIGWQMKGFYSEEGGQHREKLPLNLELGLNYRIAHAPIRLSLTIHDMQKWAIHYNLSGQATYVLKSKKGIPTEEWQNMKNNGAVMWYDMLFRHCIFAVDIVPKSEKFYLTLSYNHQRRSEMHLKDQRSLAGIGLGAGFKIKTVQLGFGMSQYSKNMFTYQVTIATNINSYLK